MNPDTEGGWDLGRTPFAGPLPGRATRPRPRGPAQDPARFYGRKGLYGLLGLVLPTLLTGFFTLIGISIPFVVPVGATVILSAVLL